MLLPSEEHFHAASIHHHQRQKIKGGVKASKFRERMTFWKVRLIT
jgi:hypothetical protein